MAIDKKFITYKTEARFNPADVNPKSIVFIQDTQRIWAQGVFFDTVDAAMLTKGILPDDRIQGTYTKLVNLTGSGDVDFARFIGNAGDTVAKPSITWTGDLTTGIYRPAASQIAVTIAGVQRVLFTSAGITGTLKGNADTATKLTTPRSFTLSEGAVGTGTTTFDGSANLIIKVTSLDAAKLSTGILPDARLSGVYTGFTHRIDGANTMFTTPSSGTSNASGRTIYGLAEYRSASSAQVGAIVFIAPFNRSTSIMKRIEIDGMLYSPSQIVRIIINNYTTGLTKKISLGSIDIPIRVGETVDNKFCIILGDITTSWSYPHFIISKAMLSHSAADASCYGWSTKLETDLTEYINVYGEIANTPLITDISGSARSIYTSPKSDNVAYHVPFISSFAAGNSDLYTDSAAHFTYNPSTNAVAATTFIGALSGNATTATTATNAGNSTTWNSQKYLDTSLATAPTAMLGLVSGNWRPTTLVGSKLFLELNNVTNESKAVMFTNPLFTVSTANPNITIKNTNSTDVGIILDRGTNANWKILNTGGTFKLQSDYTTVTGAYYDALTLAYNSGNMWVKGDISATSFIGNINANNLNTGTIPDARLTGDYTGLRHLTGSGNVDFARFLGNTTDTVSAPSLSWTNDPNTGIYWVSDDQMGVTTGGVQRALFNSSGVTVASTLTANIGNFKGAAIDGNITTGAGLDLYTTGSTSSLPQYGMAFTGTATFGKHGHVSSSDWATYFTMGGATSRGWIFKSGNAAGGNVASISSAGKATFATVDATTFTGSLDGTASNATAWNNQSYLATVLTTQPTYMMTSVSGNWRPTTKAGVELFLGLGNMAGESTNNYVSQSTARYTADLNLLKTQGLYALGAGANNPASYGTVLVSNSASDRYFQLAMGTSDGELRFRNGTSSTPNWGSWRKVWHDSNFTPGDYVVKDGTGATGNWNINAASATKLVTPRAINGTNFDGSAPITIYDNTKLPTATFDAMEIGGENLLLGSDTVIENASYLMRTYTITEKIRNGEVITITIWGELGADRSRFQAYRTDGALMGSITKVRDGLYRGTMTFVNLNDVMLNLRLYQMSSSGTSISRIDRIQLERGNQGTDWGPAWSESRYSAGANIAISATNVISASIPYYGIGTKALLDVGTDIVNSVYSPKILNDWLNGKGYILNTATNLVNYVNLTTAQSISGIKSFSNLKADGIIHTNAAYLSSTKVYSTNGGVLDLYEVVNTKGIIMALEIAQGDIITTPRASWYRQYWIATNVLLPTISRSGRNVTLTHSLGHTNYFVSATINAGEGEMTVVARYANYCTLTIDGTTSDSHHMQIYIYSYN